MSEFPLRIGRYELVEEVGSGGFATVYRAVDRRLEREVALKLMRPLLMSDSSFVKRFQREAQTAAAFDHPNIVPILDYGEADNRLFLVMKFMDGGSLEDLLAEGPLAWERTVQIVETVAAALDYAHGNGVVHRDVKPGNVLLSQDGRIMLGDFGVIKALERGTITATLSGGILGTPAYIAPEIWNEREVTAASDIYSLACLVFEMVTGEKLFEASTPPATMALHFRPPQFPEQWPSGTPPGLERVLRRALAPEPGDRFESAGAFAQALSGLSADPLAEPYVELESALSAGLWDRAVTLAERILDQDSSYRDVPDLLTRAIQRKTEDERDAWVTRWRKEAEAAIGDEDAAAALVAIKKWQRLAPDDPAAQAALERARALARPAQEREGEPAKERAREFPGRPEGTPSVLEPAPGRLRRSRRPASRLAALRDSLRRLPRWVYALSGLAVLAIVLFLLFSLGGNVPGPAATPAMESEGSPSEERPATEPDGGLGATPPDAGDSPGSAGEPSTIIIGTTDSISSLDFADAYAVHDWELFRNVNRGLMAIEPGTVNVVPEIATSEPETSEDGLTYTFTMGGDWAFPVDGECVPPVAGDFVRSVNRALTLEGDVAGLVTSYVDSVEAPDDETVVFTLSSPRGDFPQIVTGSAYMPVPEGVYPEDELNKFPEQVIGVGPWMVSEYTVEEQAVLERNPCWSGEFAASAPERVIVSYFKDVTQMALAVENGEIDIAWRTLPLPDVQRLSAVAGIAVHESSDDVIRYLVPNHSMEPFSSKPLRQALAYLIDRGEIADHFMQGAVDPLYSMVPPGFLGANEAFLDRYNPPDVAAAEELLTQEGYSADNPLTFDLWYYPSERYGTYTAQVFQLLERQFEATPMIRISLQTQEWGTYVAALTSGEYPIGYLGWIFDYPDTSNYLDPFAESTFSPTLGVSYANEEMDSLLHAAAASTDEAEREQLYVRAQNLYAEDVVTIPLITEPEFAAYRDDEVNNVVIGPTSVFPYELIELRR